MKQQSEPAVPPAASNEGRALEQVQSRQPMSWDAGADLIAQHLPANKLNLQDQHKLEQALRDNPGLWRIAGDLALQNEIRLVGLVTNQAVTSAALKRGIHEMRESLGQRDASMLERLLIDRIIMCWLNLNWIERTYMVVMSESVALPISNYWEKRLTAAQGRYLRAVETLARVRRLSRSTPLQVNIGGQQINVAGGSSP